MELLKNSYVLYIFLFIAISIEWYYYHIGKSYVKNYSIPIMILIESMIILTCISFYLGYKHKLSTTKILKEIHRFSFSDYLLFGSFAAYIVAASVIGMHFLKYHDVAKIRITNFIVSIPISAFGLYYFYSEKIRPRQIFGLLLVLGGGFLFLK